MAYILPELHDHLWVHVFRMFFRAPQVQFVLSMYGSGLQRGSDGWVWIAMELAHSGSMFGLEHTGLNTISLVDFSAWAKGVCDQDGWPWFKVRQFDGEEWLTLAKRQNSLNRQLKWAWKYLCRLPELLNSEEGPREQDVRNFVWLDENSGAWIKVHFMLAALGHNWLSPPTHYVVAMLISQMDIHGMPMFQTWRGDSFSAYNDWVSLAVHHSGWPRRQCGSMSRAWLALPPRVRAGPVIPRPELLPPDLFRH